MKLTVTKGNDSIGLVLLYDKLNENFKKTNKLSLDYGDTISLDLNNQKLESVQSIARYLAILAKEFYGTGVDDTIEIDHWLDFSQSLYSCIKVDEFANLMTSIDKSTRVNRERAYLVGDKLSIADFAIVGALKANAFYEKYADQYKTDFLVGYYNRISKSFSKLGEYQASAKPTSEAKDYSKEGKFIDLPGAEKGKVVVRFPPEASGFLHIGHAKAALLNQYYQKSFDGQYVFRFDDTNPGKEKTLFEESIIEDVKMLGIEWDRFTRTSDYFDLLIEYCEKMIRMGKAYADNTDAEQMKKEREAKIESKCRNNSVEENLRIWEEMKKGTELGQTYCIRAKIDMNALNGTMRDPTIYRCKPEPHVVTGDKYKVYPIYDLACPIVDSVENVTHALRTTEYHDRDEQYMWFLETLNLRKPYLYEYSRFNLQNTVLSKRRLTWFVESGRVRGWDDPRFPTVRGILRRGMAVEALKQFIIAQGSSRSVVQMEWDKIWTINKSIIDPASARHTALLKGQTVVVNMKGQNNEESKQVAKHPKNEQLGTKTVWYNHKLLIDEADAVTFKEGETVTFMEWGNAKINKINKSSDGKITSIDAELKLDDKDYKKTLKVTWLSSSPTSAPFTPIKCYHFDHIISKAVLEKDEDFKKYCDHQTEFVFDLLGDNEMKNLKKGQVIQISRRGYYICDEPFESAGSNKAKDGVLEGKPLVLFNIPEGNKRESPTSYMTITNQKYASQIFAEEASANKTVDAKKTKQASPAPASSANEASLYAKVKDIGDAVRDLKTKKAPKDQIDAQVKQLLAAKEEYKKQTGKDWKPDSAPASAPTPATATAAAPVQSQSDEASLYAKVKTIGDAVRDLKTKKAPKDQIDSQVKQLLAAKEEYKKLTGKDWKPDSAPASTPSKMADNNSAESISQQIKEIGDKVRNLKLNKAAKEDIDNEVKNLLARKEEYKKLTGQDWKPDGPAAAAPRSSEKKPAKQAKSQPAAAAKTEDGKKQTRLGLEAKKEENLPDWYSQIITKGELIEYYDVSGCYILRPSSYFIWEQIKEFFDREIKKLGVQNCYFPIFVSKGALEREKDHIADFAPEVAWVTRSGQSELAEPIAIRPTSETVMYPSYAKWIQSYRDLPMKLNQWNNVVRWEFKHPQPFLRTREFLWQEGHTAFAKYEEASEEVYQILDLYEQVYSKLLAVPVIKGRKTEKEKFAGADWTTTIEAFISASGRGIQAATSHHLGQNFSKMFQIEYEDPKTSEKKFVYQNSWGLTTRTIGVLTMVHGDNNGLVLPPPVAYYQVVIVPCGITTSLSKEDEEKLYEKCNWYKQQLLAADLRVHCDMRDSYSPGWKFNDWELKGIPLRIELGPKDVAGKKFVAVRRDLLKKEIYAEENVGATVSKILETMHNDLYAKAERELKEHTAVVDTWPELLSSLDAKKIIMAPFCGEIPCEDNVKKDSARDAVVEEGAPAMGAKSLCIPADQPKPITSQKCVHPNCGKAAKFYTLFGRSY